MSKQEFVWNSTQSRKIKLSTIKDFIVRGYGHEWEVLAMLSGSDSSIMYRTTSKELACAWVDNITKGGS